MYIHKQFFLTYIRHIGEKVYALRTGIRCVYASLITGDLTIGLFLFAMCIEPI